MQKMKRSRDRLSKEKIRAVSAALLKLTDSSGEEEGSQSKARGGRSSDDDFLDSPPKRYRSSTVFL